MKRVKNLTMVVLITVIGTGWAMAQGVSTGETSRYDQSDVQIMPRTDSRYKLVYPVKETESVWIKIYDSEQRMLLSERVKNKEGFMKSYDFSNLSDGLYTIDIQSKSGKITKEVYHSYKKDDIDFSVVKNPENNSLRLLVEGVSKEPVYVDILDRKSETIYEDRVDVGKSFSRVYKFKDDMPESLKLRVSTLNQTVVKEVK
jgi:hypothetical protein